MKPTSANNIVVLGASSDLGSEIVRMAATYEGTSVLAIARSKLTEDAFGPRVKAISGIDLLNEADLTRLVSEVDAKFTGPFSVIHSVGNFWIHKPLVETSFAEVRAMIESQLLTLFAVARVLTPLMISRQGGRLVAFSCNSVTYSYPDMSPFTASKAGIESFIRCYANEHAEFGISASALALPTIRTPKVLMEKPTGDHANYMQPEELAEFILDHVLIMPNEANGNVIKVFKHSPTFYHSSYYDRNPRQKVAK